MELMSTEFLLVVFLIIYPAYNWYSYDHPSPLNEWHPQHSGLKTSPFAPYDSYANAMFLLLKIFSTLPLDILYPKLIYFVYILRFLPKAHIKEQV